MVCEEAKLPPLEQEPEIMNGTEGSQQFLIKCGGAL
jgi:hypothetical protein